MKKLIIAAAMLSSAAGYSAEITSLKTSLVKMEILKDTVKMHPLTLYLSRT